MTTPDQPTGMNELREIFVKHRQHYTGFHDETTLTDDKAEAAVQQLVERCLPKKSHKAQRAYRIESCDFAAVVKEKAANKAIDQFRHNLQQAGLLRGDEGQPIPQSEIDAELRASSNIEDMFNNGELR